MVEHVCHKCAQTFATKSLFVNHLVNKTCKSQSSNKKRKVNKNIVEMPPLLPFPTQVGDGADVNSIRSSWAQQTSLNLASEQEFPPMVSNTQPPSSNNIQYPSIARTEFLSPSRSITNTQSPDILNFSCPSGDFTNSTSSGSQSPLTRTPSTSLSLNKSRLTRSCDNIMTGSRQKRCPQVPVAIARISPVQHQSTPRQKGTMTIPESAKEELEKTYVNKSPYLGSFNSRCIVPVEQALDSAEFCPVMTKGMLTQAYRNQDADLGMLMGRLYAKMEAVRKSQLKGLVHYRQSQIIWDNFLSRLKKSSSKMVRGAIMENRKGKGYLKDINHESEENTNDQRAGDAPPGREDSNNEDWYRKTSDDKAVNEGANFQSLSDSAWNILGNVTRNVLDILQTNGVTVTPVKADKVTTEENKEFYNSEGILLKDEVTAEVEVEEMGTCPLCEHEMLMRLLPQHASDCQGP